MNAVRFVVHRAIWLGLLLGTAIVCTLASASAQNVGVHVNVAGNLSGALASNIKESDGLVSVTPGPSDMQITFTAVLDSPFTLSSHSSVIVIDAGELGFASSAELTGLGFVSGFEGDPGRGSSAIVLSNFGSATGVTNLFRVTYDLAMLAQDGSVDCTLFVTGVNVPPGENIVDELADEAFIRVDAPASRVPALSGAGTAALVMLLGAVGAYAVRRKPRRDLALPSAQLTSRQVGGRRSRGASEPRLARTLALPGRARGPERSKGREDLT